MGLVDMLRGLRRLGQGQGEGGQKALSITFDPTFIPHADLPRTLFGNKRLGFDSNVVMAPVMWIMRTFTEAHAIVERKIPGKKLWEHVEDHGAEVLMDKPNDFYDGDALWKATCISYVLDGNAYWRKVRNSIGEVIELWYLPHWLVSPRWPQDGSRFISHYDYNHGNGPPEKIAKRDIIHLRFGLDPTNPRVGLSPLRALLREIFTDDEAANFSSKILVNMGVPGLVVSPKTDAYRPDGEAVEKLQSSFTGEQRGRALILTRPTDVTQFGFDPNKLSLAQLRDVVEERVCACIGLPAAVVGFGAGMQSTKVGATMRELRKLAWVTCLTPMQTTMGRELTVQLLPDFQAQLRRFRVRFDTVDVQAFQEEDDITTQRVVRMVQGGLLRVDRGQDMLGLEVDPKQEVYLRPANVEVIGKDGKPVKKPVPPPPAVPPGGTPPGGKPPEPADGTNPQDGPPGRGEPPAPAKSDEQVLAEIAERVLGRQHANGDRPHEREDQDAE